MNRMRKIGIFGAFVLPRMVTTHVWMQSAVCQMHTTKIKKHVERKRHEETIGQNGSVENSKREKGGKSPEKTREKQPWKTGFLSLYVYKCNV